MMLESKFQTEVIADLRDLFPGCVVLKNDPNYIQGFPDLLILWNRRWAALEVKASAVSRHQPNQDYYVDMLDDMSYGAFIFPENKETILDELVSALRA
jgi:hypothetical protein